MTALVEIGLANLAMAALLAVVAAGVARCLRKPALSHALWLLVFVKLITPPLIPVPVLAALDENPGVGAPQSEVGKQELDDGIRELAVRGDAPAAPVVEVDNGGLDEGRPEPVVDFPLAAAPPAPFEGEPHANVQPLPAATGFPWILMLQVAWLTGTAGLLLLACVRSGRFQRILRLAKPAPEDLTHETRRLAGRLHVRCPEVLLLDAVAAPMVWVSGWRGRLLLPARLLGRLSMEQRSALLAHELAHLRRGDPWVRYLEMLVVALYWWCPLVWWARRELREAEEECCDAWVLWAVPGSARAYALALVETVDFLAEARPRLPALASGFGHVSLLRRRLTMIMRGNTPRALGALGAIAVLAVAALALPLLPARAVVAQEPPASKTDDKTDPRTREIREMAERLREMRAQLEKEQQALREKQIELEKHFRNLHEAMRKLGVTPEGRPGAPGGGPPRLPRRDNGFPGTPPVPAVPQPPLRRDRPELEKRLGDLERVLQQLLHEITNLRRELAPPGSRPGGGGRPGDDPAGRPGRTPGAAPPGTPSRPVPKRAPETPERQ